MSKRKRDRVKGKAVNTAAAKRGSIVSPLFLLAAAIIILILFISWRSSSLFVSPFARPATEARVAAPLSASSNSEFQKLKGRWRRPDGGYIMAINNINDSGAIEAAYFNPYPIHVGNAVASRDGSLTKVFLELRDINYPGSTYHLSYDPSGDRLRGTYYQAVERQSFQVVFERMK